MAAMEKGPEKRSRDRGQLAPFDQSGSMSTPRSIEAQQEERVIQNVSLFPFFNKKRELQEYRSLPEPGGKVVVVRDLTSVPDAYSSYSVRVLKDTRPDDPSKGALIVEIIPTAGPVDKLQHRQAAHARQQHIRQSRGFDVIARMINSDPDLAAEYHPMVARHKEFKSGLHQSVEDRHRNYTGMLAGLMMSERGHALMDRVIDRTIAEKSTTYKNVVEAAQINEFSTPYVPGVVVGTGPYGSVLAHTRQMFLPDVPEMTLDQNARIGGQFAQYRGKVFRTNSRNRRELPDEPHLPGTEQSLNSMGQFAAVQPSDLSGESYPFQNTIADAARLNFFLSGEAMTRAELKKIRPNRGRESEGSMFAEYLDKDTGKIHVLSTDRVTLATGLGKERSGLDESDPTTRNTLKEQAEKFERGEDARVLSFTQFVRKMSDPTDPFPLKNMKTLVVSGSKDGANVVLGIVAGYESQVGKTTMQLDRVQSISLVGAKVETKEEFLATCRARYALIGLEFPRQQFENYYSRIKPFPGEQSRLIRMEEDGVRVTIEDEQRTGGIDLSADYYVYNHGFEDDTDRIIAPLYRAEVTFLGAGFADRIRRRERLEGIEVFYKPELSYTVNDLKRLEILSVKGDLVEVATIDTENSYNETTIFFEELADAYLQERKISKVEIPSTGITPEFFASEVVASVRGTDRAIAKYYRRNLSRDGTGVYKVGPAPALPVSREEVEAAPVLRTIPENTAAIFRYIDYAEALAKKLALEDTKKGVTRAPLFDSLVERGTERLQTVESAPQLIRKFTSEVRLGERIGLTESSADLMKLAVGDALARYEFDSTLSEVRLTIRLQDEDIYGITLSPALPRSYTPVLRYDLVEDSLMQGLLAKILATPNIEAVELTIPLERGKVRAEDISFKTLKQKAETIDVETMKARVKNFRK
ncbi:MAG TPA: hypothetical protein VN495_02055 [Candidatus Paceibacterota bacterium]|nr:hypothetical protein [Candidatus Paceibacterota bacterium]